MPLSLLYTVVCFLICSLPHYAVAAGVRKGKSKKERVSRKQQRPRLSFSEQGTFKIMQLTDMHLGEAQFSDWGPQQDVKTYSLLSSLIPYEAPDLLLLSGDQLTGNNCNENATTYYEQMGKFLEKFEIPWALVFGNHDDSDFEYVDENGTRHYVEAKTKRPKLAQSLEQFSHSLNEIGPLNITGTSNYILPIHDSDDSGETVSQIILLDSGGGSIPSSFNQSQVDWLGKQLYEKPIPTAVFQHIPMAEFQYDDNKCVGTHNDGVAYVNPDSGMFSLIESNNNVMFVAAGHNHGNDYCCRVSNASLHLCFGRHSGYGGYTAVTDRGARVYELHLMNGIANGRTLGEFADDSIISWESWVRIESGEVIDEYKPLLESYDDTWS
jgi:predicted MPP superfamily phosphohydrolase